MVNSEAKSWHQDSSRTHAPEKAYDGDLSTFYSVKDGDTDGNFLKLYLSKKFWIGTVLLTNRETGCCEQRITGTVVKVYSTTVIGDEIKVADCGGEITGKETIVTTTFIININNLENRNVFKFFFRNQYSLYRSLNRTCMIRNFNVYLTFQITTAI